jgi:hypothetical protein
MKCMYYLSCALPGSVHRVIGFRMLNKPASEDLGVGPRYFYCPQDGSTSLLRNVSTYPYRLPITRLHILEDRSLNIHHGEYLKSQNDRGQYLD